MRRKTFYWLKRIFYHAMNARKRLLPNAVWGNTGNTILEDIPIFVALAEKAAIVKVISSYTQESTRGMVFRANSAVKCLEPSSGNNVMNQNTTAFTGSAVGSVEKDLMRSLYI